MRTSPFLATNYQFGNILTFTFILTFAFYPINCRIGVKFKLNWNLFNLRCQILHSIKVQGVKYNVLNEVRGKKFTFELCFRKQVKR